MPRPIVIAASSVALLLIAGAEGRLRANDEIDLTTWDPSLLHRGWRATEFFGSRVYGQGGEVIGQVDNFYVDRDGKVTKVIVEAGGVLDIGDVHLAVPWDQVQTWPGEDGILVPMNRDNVPQFSLFREDPDPGVAAWRATDLIHDVVYLASGDQYGLVDDLIVNDRGQLEAVVVSPDIGFADRERRALPWAAEGYDPAHGRYALSYDLREIETLGPFDYEAMESRPDPARAQPMPEGQQGN